MRIGIFWHWQLTPADSDDVKMLKEDVMLDNATKLDVMWNETQHQLLFFCDGWFGTPILEEAKCESDSQVPRTA